MNELKNASSLGVLSRSVVNRNVKREDVDSLPLPRSLRDECFANVATDRSNESFRQTSLLEPCDCYEFPENLFDFYSWMGNFETGSHLLYSSDLPGLPKSAEWLELPDRETLIYRLRYAKSDRERKRMQACLNTLRFDPTTGLGDVHEWIRRYLYHENEHGWYRVRLSATLLPMFLRAVKDISVVVLPYGCVTGYYGREHSAKDWRNVILAVKNDDKKFWRAMESLEFESYLNAITRIHNAMQLAHTIAFVGRSQIESLIVPKNYVVFRPVIRHAYFWMLLIIPHGYRKDGCNERKKLELENCVVLFDPLQQCIGDPVETWRADSPHVYWFDGQILNVKEIPDVVHRGKQTFVRWCAARKMNTLLNLNDNCLFQPLEWYQQ